MIPRMASGASICSSRHWCAASWLSLHVSQITTSFPHTMMLYLMPLIGYSLCYVRTSRVSIEAVRIGIQCMLLDGSCSRCFRGLFVHLGSSTCRGYWERMLSVLHLQQGIRMSRNSLRVQLWIHLWQLRYSVVSVRDSELLCSGSSRNGTWCLWM